VKIRCNELLHTHGQKKLTLQCASQSSLSHSSLNCPVHFKIKQSNRTRDHNTGGRCIQRAGSAVWYIWYDIYLLTAIGLTPGGSSSVHIYPQTIHWTTQLTTLVGRLSGIRTQSSQTNWEESGPSPVFASYTLACALQLRKKYGKTSVRVAEECQLARRKQNIQNRQELQTSLNDMFVVCQACVRVQGGYFQHFLKRVVSCIVYYVHCMRKCDC